MKDSIFWRVIGVGVVVGLFMIGFGLCKNSQIPSPSFSSVAYAEDATPEKPGAKKSPLVFTIIGVRGFDVTVARAKVIGGWLIVSHFLRGNEAAVGFYPDPKHEWDGGSLE
jgi:hypothetical protein